MYTVTIYASRMPILIQFAVHTWTVTEHDGKKDRFDVFGFKEGNYPLTTGTYFASIGVLAKKLVTLYHEIHDKRPQTRLPKR